MFDAFLEFPLQSHGLFTFALYFIVSFNQMSSWVVRRGRRLTSVSGLSCDDGLLSAGKLSSCQK